MVDTWATVRSGTQIGRNVHLAGGAGIGEAPARSLCGGATRAKSLPGGEFGMHCLLVVERPAGGKLALEALFREPGLAFRGRSGGALLRLVRLTAGRCRWWSVVVGG